MSKSRISFSSLILGSLMGGLSAIFSFSDDIIITKDKLQDAKVYEVVDTSKGSHKRKDTVLVIPFKASATLEKNTLSAIKSGIIKIETSSSSILKTLP